jgi:glyoxylase-like metal-dependent hydrolase (beta-lactamase superfamily II)
VIHALSIPTPFAVGSVNCYLVEDEPLTLVDTGPNWATSLVELEQAMAAHGHRVEDLERIVVTHQHIDHIGLVQILAERSQAEVCALDRLAPWLADYRQSMDDGDDYAMAIMVRNGVPRDIAIALRSLTRVARAWGAPATVTCPLADATTLPFAGRTWRVLHLPGHSPSDTVFHDEASGELIAGDHLIGHISSNALMSRPLEGGAPEHRPPTLKMYIDSLRVTRALDVSVVLPGHGEPVRDHRSLIDERFAQNERRAEKLHALLAAGGPLTAHDLAQRLWGKVAFTQAFLTISEILGHLDLLRDDGLVVEEVRGETSWFQTVA